jgi:hypothetical protein
MASPCVFLAISAAKDLGLFRLDIDNAFLYAPIKEYVYVKQPLEFIDGATKICHFQRRLYGRKHSPREFNEPLLGRLVSQDWTQCKSDSCIYIYRRDKVFARIGVYVDDLPLVCYNIAWVSEFKSTLNSRFKTKDLGGLNITS